MIKRLTYIYNPGGNDKSLHQSEKILDEYIVKKGYSSRGKSNLSHCCDPDSQHQRRRPEKECRLGDLASSTTIFIQYIR